MRVIKKNGRFIGLILMSIAYYGSTMLQTFFLGDKLMIANFLWALMVFLRLFSIMYIMSMFVSLGSSKPAKWLYVIISIVLMGILQDIFEPTLKNLWICGIIPLCYLIVKHRNTVVRNLKK